MCPQHPQLSLLRCPCNNAKMSSGASLQGPTSDPGAYEPNDLSFAGQTSYADRSQAPAVQADPCVSAFLESLQAHPSDKRFAYHNENPPQTPFGSAPCIVPDGYVDVSSTSGLNDDGFSNFWLGSSTPRASASPTLSIASTAQSQQSLDDALYPPHQTDGWSVRWEAGDGCIGMQANGQLSPGHGSSSSPGAEDNLLLFDGSSLPSNLAVGEVIPGEFSYPYADSNIPGEVYVPARAAVETASAPPKDQTNNQIIYNGVKVIRLSRGTKNKSFPCPYCPKAFTRNFALKRHTSGMICRPADRRRAGGSRRDSCGDSSNSNSNDNGDDNDDKGDKTCEHCQKRFARKDGRDQHLKVTCHVLKQRRSQRQNNRAGRQ